MRGFDMTPNKNRFLSKGKVIALITWFLVFGVIVFLGLRDFDGPGSADVSGPVHDPILATFEFDLIVNDQWRFSIRDLDDHDLLILPPFDIVFEAVGPLADHLDDWSLEVGGEKLPWGEALSFPEGSSQPAFMRLVETDGDTRIDFLSKIQPDSKVPLGRLSGDSISFWQEDESRGLSKESSPDFTVDLTRWTAYQTSAGERTGFDARFVIRHSSFMGSECRVVDIAHPRMVNAWNVYTTVLLGWDEPRGEWIDLNQSAPFGGPGKVDIRSERQHWSEWTQGDDQTTVDVSVRVLPMDQGLELLASQRANEFAQMKDSKDLSQLGRKWPARNVILSFSFMCGSVTYRCRSTFRVPLTGIEILEQPPAGSSLDRSD
jgi:hypothetical protein